MPLSVGNTPLVKLDRISKNLFGKCEYLNPTGSVKDRAAANMLKKAEESGKIKGKEVLDSSSGNTGISLASFGASMGYKVTIVIPSSASIERQKLLKLYGASIVYSDPMEGSDGAIIVAKKLASENPEKYFYIDQYSNDANWEAHYFGTAEEIWRQTKGKITHFVAGVGTGGTIMGTGKRLRELNSKIKIIAVEPDSPFHGLEGLKHIESSIKPRIFDPNFPDETIFIKTEDAQSMVKRLSRDQGVFVGTSSGATVEAALEYANAEEACVVAILADQGSRYLSEKYLQE
ncbi:MAG: PLP-dependent cysteine synthase family protein [Nitrososphaerales archaeon]